MNLLGINGFSHSKDFFAQYYNRVGIDRNRVLGHDAGAAIFKDGVLIAAVEEERLNREKKTSCFPIQSIQYCLKEANLKIEDIDYVAFPWNFNRETTIAIIKSYLETDKEIDKIFNIIDQYKELYTKLVSYEYIIRDFNQNMNTQFANDKFIFVPHHMAHLMCGFYTSDCADAAFLVSDGRAEQYSSIIGEITKDRVTIFDESSNNLNNSLGLFYSKFTRYLGFMPNNDEYKIMALSDFGDKKIYADKQPQIISYKENGTYKIDLNTELYNNLSYYDYFNELFGVADYQNMSFQQKCDIAAFAQDIVEKATRHQLLYLRGKTKLDHLIYEGGTALNCKNNGKLLIEGIFKDIHISYGASDVGLPVGAAFYVYYQQKMFKPSRISCYTGPSIREENVEAVLKQFSEKIDWKVYEKEAELLEKTIDEIFHGKIVAWCQGKIELGPRALGNRSILANPSIKDMKDMINHKIKFREPFRPFAMSILEDKASEYFHLCGKSNSPYMTFTFKVKDQYKELLRSAIHVDDTSRIQTVSKDDNRLYWKLLDTFYRKYNVPGIINTSFNIQGQPIICFTKDSVECLLKTGIDLLVIDNYFVTKKPS